MKKLLQIVALGVLFLPPNAMADDSRPEAAGPTGIGMGDGYGMVYIFGHPSVETVKNFAARYEERVAAANKLKKPLEGTEHLDEMKAVHRDIHDRGAYPVGEYHPPRGTPPAVYAPAPQGAQK